MENTVFFVLRRLYFLPLLSILTNLLSPFFFTPSLAAQQRFTSLGGIDVSLAPLFLPFLGSLHAP